MSSYQNNPEEGNASFVDVDANSRSKRNWGSLALVCGLGITTGVFALSASSFSKSAGSSVFTSTNKGSAKVAYKHQYSGLRDDEYASLFSEFKSKFNRQYADDNEEADRFDNFKLFLSRIDVLNDKQVLNGGDAIHGITKFSDMLESEFASIYLGYKAPKNSKMPKKVSATREMQAAAKAQDSSVVDWYMTYTTAVKNQGYCGSCWAFSATEQIESDSIRSGLLTTSDALSPEQIVNCAPESDDCYGCDGGWPLGAYEYVESAGGIESETNYPYDSYYGNDDTCTATPSEYEVTVTDYYTLDSEDDMITYVTGTGPLSVCVDASTWSSYTMGVVSVCGNDLDHCVQVTGINSEEGYWIVRNSWGTDWGEDGFIYVKSGSDMCGIAYVPSYTSVQSV